MREGHSEKSRHSLQVAKRLAGSQVDNRLQYMIGEAIVHALWDISDAIDANTEAFKQGPQPTTAANLYRNAERGS